MIPYVKGTVAKQAHVGIPEGIHEEEYGRAGFFGRYAHLYRTHPPVAWSRIEGDLRPQAFDSTQQPDALDFLSGRRPYLCNQDVQISFSRFHGTMPYFFRNADGDEILFVHAGTGCLETDFGPISYEPGDYLVIPRGTCYRVTPEQAAKILVVEAQGEVRLPDKGMLGQHALFDPAVLQVPEPAEVAADLKGSDEYELRIKRQGQITKVFYPFCPIDAIGWKGTLTVWKLNIRDIRPVSCDRYHLPPSAHTTFLVDGAAICTFLPRPLENGDDEAMKVPFYHSNIDYDEMIFYHDGEFFSRAGIHSGMMTFHPQGIHHGPQPEAIARSRSAKVTNEVAVMVDTLRPLEVADSCREFEVSDYWQSWRNT